MWELTIRTDFSAAHQLREYEGVCERLHGHNWTVEITVRCRRLDHRGIALDFKDLQAAARDVLAELDHSLLNDLAPFAEQNPSAENIARHIFRGMAGRMAAFDTRVWKVVVHETPGCSAAYLEEDDEPPES
jgi:6-pyruvoyltetrahydropterin/6-carboxytetrahydropterin synthase